MAFLISGTLLLLLLLLFSWSSASPAAPLACEDLVRPLGLLHPHSLAGRWAMVAGSLSHLPSWEKFRQRDSASIYFYGNTSESGFSYSRSICMGNSSMHTLFNISLEGSSFTYDGIDRSNASASFVRTSCRDCLLMRMHVASGSRIHFYLFSRRRGLEQEEMDEFKAQVRCLDMPPPTTMDPEKPLCLEDPPVTKDHKRG